MNYYYVITFTKIHHKITEEEKEQIMSVEFDRKNMSDGSVLTNNNIADILPEEKYFETFPDRRPPEVYDSFQENYGSFVPSGYSKNAKEYMKRGFIDAQMTVYGKTVEQAEARFAQIMQGKDNLFRSM